MATVSRPIDLPLPSPTEIYRIPIAQYESFVEDGRLQEDEPIELLDGVMVKKMPKGPRHSKCAGRCRRELERILQGDHHLRVEDPIRIPEFSEPEPDLSIVRGDDDRYTYQHPSASDVVLIVEIAETSLARDRGVKRDIYAHAGVPEYWIVDLAGRRVEVYREPREGAYPPPIVVGEDGGLELVVDGARWGRIDVAAILP